MKFLFCVSESEAQVTIMSAAYSSSSLNLGSGTSTTALCLSVTSNRKHFSFDERERIKKRRKQLNPVRLSVEHVEDTLQVIENDNSEVDTDKHIIYSFQPECTSSFSLDHETSVDYKVESLQVLKAELEPGVADLDQVINFKTESLSPTLDLIKEEAVDLVPLNLTKNTRIKLPDLETKLEVKTEPQQLCSPRKDEPPKIEPTQLYSLSKDESAKYAKSESPAYDHFLANVFVDDKKDLSPSPFSPRTPPTLVMRSVYTNAVTRTTCRIFNPEAFCNFCQKEFCNKYFLKTHKANKHGIYCENKESTADVELPAVPLMFTWNVKNNNVKVPSNPYLCNSNAVKDSSAFCNICEKEFCNKYFVRRHKEKMHGIVPFNENRKTDAEPEKSEDDEKMQLDDIKFPVHERNTELILNSRPEKTKSPRHSGNTTDVVSDFIKTCLVGYSGRSAEDLEKNSDDRTKNYQPYDSENASNLIKRKENLHFDQVSKLTVQNDLRCRTKLVATGEFGVQAKEEDFSELSNPDSLKTISEHDDYGNKYMCEYCKKSLSSHAVLRLHQKYVHFFTVDEDSDDEAEFKHLENIYFMILKFSWLNTTVTYCEICHMECEKNDVLEMHLMNKHGIIVDELSRIIEDAGVNGLSAPALQVSDGKILCQICNKTFSTNAAFQQHVYEKCTYNDLSADCYVAVDDTDSSSKATRNFCEICKKELCNKYFMKTHMRRMHGIAIQNGIRIGGVTCEICNKELCSKYFLRVHKKNCHGVMEKIPFGRLMTQDNEKLEASQACTICGRIFKSIKWLKTHLLNDHGKLGSGIWQDILIGVNVEGTNDSSNELSAETSLYPEEDSQFQCSRCHFQAASIDALLAHQRLHVKNADQLQHRCIYCFIVTKDKISLEEHIACCHLGSHDLQEKNEYATRYCVTSGMYSSIYKYFCFVISKTLIIF